MTSVGGGEMVHKGEVNAGGSRISVSHRGLLLAFFSVTVLGAYFPFVLAGYMPMRLFMIASALVCIAQLPRSVGAVGMRLNFFFALTLIVFALIATSLVRLDAAAAPFAMNFERWFILSPLFFWLGLRISAGRAVREFMRAYLAVSLVVALLAMIEWWLNGSIFGRDALFNYLTRSDRGRAVVGSDHPLVLGLLLAASIPTTSVLRNKRQVLVAFSLLIGGVYATGSRGPLVISLVAGACLIVLRNPKWRESVSGPLNFVIVFGFLVLSYFAAFVWSSEIVGSSGYDYSSGYREALYSLLPQMLTDFPFGAGFGDLPSGVYTINSDFLGLQDVSRTIDSEVVYLALQAGLFGVGIYLAAIWISARALRFDATVAIFALTLGLGGLFLALHAWDSVGPIWLLAVGLSAGVASPRRFRAIDPVRPAAGDYCDSGSKRKTH